MQRRIRAPLLLYQTFFSNPFAPPASGAATLLVG
ncbi:hypothetical protein DR64_4910 [Paraburkholderia xenovorans LB400]|nr:hypothetical protein DR64_4910 [Paraburkholderia xenovorans LB400]